MSTAAKQKSGKAASGRAGAGKSTVVLSNTQHVHAAMRSALKAAWAHAVGPDKAYDSQGKPRNPTLTSDRVLGVVEALVRNRRFMENAHVPDKSWLPKGTRTGEADLAAASQRLLGSIDKITGNTDDCAEKNDAVCHCVVSAIQTMAATADPEHVPSGRAFGETFFAVLVGMLGLTRPETVQLLAAMQEHDGSGERSSKAKAVARKTMLKMSRKERQALIASLERADAAGAEGSDGGSDGGSDEGSDSEDDSE